MPSRACASRHHACLFDHRPAGESHAPSKTRRPHRHGQAFVYAYVLKGAVRSALDDGPPSTYRAGDNWFEPPGARHPLTENASRTQAARLLVVFVANTGDALKTPDQP
jgi:quercetin dioxygenase-like cupin family protein